MANRYRRIYRRRFYNRLSSLLWSVSSQIGDWERWAAERVYPDDDVTACGWCYIEDKVPGKLLCPSCLEQQERQHAAAVARNKQLEKLNG